jgi:hypothetical protein
MARFTGHASRFTSFLVYWVSWVGKDSRITGVMPTPTVQVMQPILQPQD